MTLQHRRGCAVALSQLEVVPLIANNTGDFVPPQKKATGVELAKISKVFQVAMSTRAWIYQLEVSLRHPDFRANPKSFLNDQSKPH
jgi:hypothetical protein